MPFRSTHEARRRECHLRHFPHSADCRGEELPSSYNEGALSSLDRTALPVVGRVPSLVGSHQIKVKYAYLKLLSRDGIVNAPGLLLGTEASGAEATKFGTKERDRLFRPFECPTLSSGSVAYPLSSHTPGLKSKVDSLDGEQTMS